MFKGFQKPKRLVANTETLTERYGMFTAQPFQRGFGTTIGNSLRRVLNEVAGSRSPRAARNCLPRQLCHQAVP